MKLVSIIVPAYNVEKTIEKCLKSLMAQTARGTSPVFPRPHQLRQQV